MEEKIQPLKNILTFSQSKGRKDKEKLSGIVFPNQLFLHFGSTALGLSHVSSCDLSHNVSHNITIALNWTVTASGWILITV